ncbi:ABC transporter ATP-binding protein/permease [Clostridium sporogenes]|uniref:ABC transporter ATP-binding protein n=1 Tax=Clostridium sporogenes TaxID=1509 RepID=UPI001C128678|nr:ABC transporter ATP-binding protein [Clostridium sporogenes]MBU5299503.1 ABC transporter ATP-binding protein/permease [Clostridium sporogenes]
MKAKMFSFFKTIRYCLLLSWRVSKLYTILRITLLILIILLPYVSMMCSKLLLDILSTSTNYNYDFTNAIFLMGAIIVIAIGSKVLFQLNTYFQNIHSEKIIYNINKVIMTKTMNANIEFYDSPEYLDTLQAIMSDSSALNNITWNILDGISNMVSLFIALAMISKYNWRYGLLLIIVSIPSVVVSKHYSKLLYNWRISNLSSERQQNYVQSIANDRYFSFDIRAHNLANFLLVRYKEFWDICFNGRRILRKKQVICIIPTYILPEAFIFYFMISIIQKVLAGNNSVGDFSLYLGLFTSLMGAVEMAISSFSAVYDDKLKVDTVSRFDQYGEEDDKSGKILLKENFDLEFKNVSFKYPKSDRYILKNLSFKVKSGTKLCILGVNGSGKSTLIKLMMRFYDVTDGEILINSINIKEYSILSLRRNFSVVFQDYINYAFTLRENIRITDLEKLILSDVEIEKLLDTVCAQELLGKLSKGADTYIQRIFDREGYEPSGGERQKIALARAINRECKVLILDEPTASLDPESENNLFKNIKNKFANKTIIFTSHRLATVHLADNIILLEKGEILEEGNHSQLMHLNQKYAKLYKLQADNYK